MSDTVQIEGLTSENAVLLLAAAEELGLDPGVVQTTSENVFNVPAEVAKKAGLKPKADEDDAAAAADVDEDSTKAELQEAAKDRGLSTTGNKDELLAAIRDHDAKGE